jgi:hypothetical protein
MTEGQNERLNLPSASAWHRYEICAGSFQLEGEARRIGQIAHEDSPAARRGTLIHAWLAGEVDEDGEPIKLDFSEQQTADFLQQRMQGEVQRIFGDQPVQQLNEKRLWLVINGEKMLSGRFDRVVYTDSRALVQEAKTGWAEPVEAEQNAQLKVLAVLVALHMPKTLREVVCQLCSGPYGITEARYDYPKLSKAYEEILSTLKALNDPMAPLNPSPPACRFCGALNICQAVKNFILPVAKTQISALPEGARGAKLLDEVEVIQEHLDSIREYYSARLAQDPAFDLPGYAMVPGNTRREVKSENWEAVRQRLSEWLDLSEIEAASNYRLGDLERALGRKLKIKGKELKERMGQILGDLIESKENAPSLKRVSAKGRVVVELP